MALIRIVAGTGNGRAGAPWTNWSVVGRRPRRRRVTGSSAAARTAGGRRLQALLRGDLAKATSVLRSRQAPQVVDVSVPHNTCSDAGVSHSNGIRFGRSAAGGGVGRVGSRLSTGTLNGALSAGTLNGTLNAGTLNGTR